jgi:SAM-dependent methyltransferase
MSLKDYYEDSYKTDSGRSLTELQTEALQSSKGLFHFVEESKSRFLPDLPWSGLNCLEMGSGLGGLSLHFARLGANITLVDFSPTALKQAESIFALEGLTPKTIEADLGLPNDSIDQKYDLILDSHLLHCITSAPERSSYFKLISDALTDRGIFVAETMVHRKKLFVPDGFMFDQNYVLWQMFGEWKPVRKIPDSLDLEKEIIEAGLNISYFYYYGQFSFVPHRKFMDIPAEVLPASVRMVLQKKHNTQS